MATKFFSRSEKAQWGFACNQSAAGRLWAGKGERLLAAQLGHEIAEAVDQAIEQTRGNRCGRFWVDLENRTVTMQVGASDDNEVDQADF